MDRERENVRQAKESFDRVLGNKVYANIIKDDKHLSLLLGLIKGHDYKKILDIGTGTGYLAFPLAEEYPLSTVYGIDIAENVIAKNNEYAKENGIPNIIFQIFDGLEYPFENETFDLIVTRYAFHHFPNVKKAIQQMHKLLVPGGKVLISDPMRDEKDSERIIDEFMRVKKDGHIQFYSREEIDELFWGHGFIKEKQVITNMKFPFAQKNKYVDLYNKITDENRQLYDIINKEGVIWVQHVDVGNTIYVKG